MSDDEDMDMMYDDEELPDDDQNEEGEGDGII